LTVLEVKVEKVVFLNKKKKIYPSQQFLKAIFLETNNNELKMLQI